MKEPPNRRPLAYTVFDDPHKESFSDLETTQEDLRANYKDNLSLDEWLSRLNKAYEQTKKSNTMYFGGK